MDAEIQLEAEAIPEIGEDGSAVPVPQKKRGPGRPKGSKTRQRPKVERVEPGEPAPARSAPRVRFSARGIPPQATKVFARLPMMVADFAATNFMDLPLAPYMSPALVEDAEKAFNAWLASMDVELSPGEAYLAACVAAIGGAVLSASMHAAAKARAGARNGATGPEVVNGHSPVASGGAAPAEPGGSGQASA